MSLGLMVRRNRTTDEMRCILIDNYVLLEQSDSSAIPETLHGFFKYKIEKTKINI